MPDYPSWFQQIPEIIVTLRRSDALVVDRFSIEQLFHVSRRQAIRLMHGFGGYQVGRTFLVDRDQLLRRLETYRIGAPISQASGRKRRIWHELAEQRLRIRAQAVAIDQTRQALSGGLAALPEGVVLERGRLEIVFDRPEDLLQRLYALSQALAADYVQFTEEYEEQVQQVV